jgi:hypothetical protein
MPALPRLAALALFASLLVAARVHANPVVTPGFLAAFLSQDFVDSGDEIFIGDLNGDGRKDAVEVTLAGDVHTLFGRADGYFDPGPLSATLWSSRATSEGGLADLDGDGKLDFALLTGGWPASWILLMHGDGAGGFAAPRTIVAHSDAFPPADDYYADAAFGEFTGDGLPDVAATRRVQTNLYELAIYAGTPSGEFQYLYSFPPTATPFANVTVLARDLDGDGRTDLLRTADAQLLVYHGLPGGGFADVVSVPLPDLASDLGVGDFDGDGRIDLATHATTVNGVRIAYGNALGGYDAQVLEPTVANPGAFRCADTDGDGKDEIVYVSSRVTIEPVDGQTSTARFVGIRRFAQSWRVADFDQDGADDLAIFEAAAYGNSPAVSALTLVLSPPSGKGSVDIPTGAGPTQVVLFDVDRDGNVDVVTTDFASNQLSILWGDGAGGLPTRTDLPTGAGPDAVAIALVDGDEWPDLVVSQQSAGTFGVLRGLGGRTFAPVVASPAGSHPRGLAVGDVTGDGFPDIAIAFDLLNQVKIFPGDGAGNFGSPEVLATGSGPVVVMMVDLDRDGRLDLIYGMRLYNVIGVRYGQAKGVGAEVLASGSIKLNRIVVLDADHDDRLDLASMGAEDSDIRIARADGVGGFSYYGKFTPRTLIDLAAGDFDGDGDDELAFLSDSPGGGVVGTNAVMGPGNVSASRAMIGASPDAWAMAAGDLNHDQRPDLVTISKLQSSATVLLNRNTGPIVGVEPVPSAPGRLRFASRMPTRGAFALQYDAPGATAGELRLLSVRGAVVQSQRIEASEGGPRTLQVVPNGLRAGVYWAEVRQGSFKGACKVVLLP